MQYYAMSNGGVGDRRWLDDRSRDMQDHDIECEIDATEGAHRDTWSELAVAQSWR